MKKLISFLLAFLFLFALLPFSSLAEESEVIDTESVASDSALPEDSALAVDAEEPLLRTDDIFLLSTESDSLTDDVQDTSVFVDGEAQDSVASDSSSEVANVMEEPVIELAAEPDSFLSELAADAALDGESGFSVRQSLSYYQPVFDCALEVMEDYSSGIYNDYDYEFDLELCGGYEKVWCQLGYRLEDIDKNGIPELIIGRVDDDEAYGPQEVIIALFTLEDDEPVQLFNSASRNRYYFSTKGDFQNVGSGGAGIEIGNVLDYRDGKFYIIEAGGSDVISYVPTFDVIYYHFQCPEGLEMSFGEWGLTLPADFVDYEKANQVSESEFSVYLSELEYADDNCILPVGELTPITEDMSFSFTMQRDNWSFLNSPYVFKPNFLAQFINNYEISSADYSALCQGLSKDEQARIDDAIASDWKGSCFGMSTSAALLYSGYLNIEKFDESAETTYDATLKRNLIASDVGEIESMINYYQMSQFTDAIRWLRFHNLNTTLVALNEDDIEWLVEDLDYGDSYRISALLKGVVTDINRTAGEPVVLGVKMLLDGVVTGGHAVIATDCSYDSSSQCYNIKIYDCSLSTKSFYDAKIIVDEDGCYSFSAPAWEKAWNRRIVPYYAISAEVYVDAFELLTAPGYTSQKSWSGTSTSSRIINTDSSAFIISDGVNSAVIANGHKVSGDLDILCYGAVNEVDAPIEYEFALADDVGNAITIVDTSDGEYEYSFWQHDDELGYYNTVSSDTQGTIVCGEDGSIRTELEAVGNLTMTMCNTTLTSDWYNLEVSGVSDGLTLSGEGNSVTVENAEEDVLQISLTNGMDAVEVGEVNSESGTITMTEAEDECVVMDGNKIIETVDYGYTVSFTCDDEAVFPEQTGYLYGTAAECPGSVCKFGYVFNGWYLDENCTQMWNFDTDTVPCSLTLYAGLTPEDAGSEKHLDADGDGCCDICGEDGFVLQPGDFNGDLRVDGKDVVRVVKCLLGSSTDACVSTDTNHDGKSNLSDVVHLLRYMLGADVWLYG